MWCLNVVNKKLDDGVAKLGLLFVEAILICFLDFNEGPPRNN